jgi:hypothetical protein
VKRLSPLLLGVAVALGCQPGQLRFGDDYDGGDGGPPDSGPGDAGPCGGCAGLPLRCYEDAGRCVECLGDGDCGLRPICDHATLRCVECTTAAQCPGTTPGCDPLTHRCGRACTSSLECVGFEGCGAAMLCKLCDDNGECAARDAGRCDTRLGRCVECSSDLECAAPASRCDLTRGRCAACLTSLDCGAGRTCEPTRQICAP